MSSMRLDAQDEKYRATKPSRRHERKSQRPHVKTYLRTVRPNRKHDADEIVSRWATEGSM